MKTVSLPAPYEATIQAMERLGRTACRKIDEATQAVDEDESGTHELVLHEADEISVVRHAIELRQVADHARVVVRTPPRGSKLPVNEETPSGVRRRR